MNTDITANFLSALYEGLTKKAMNIIRKYGSDLDLNRTDESGYFAIRATLTQSISKASEYIAKSGLTEEGAPALVRLITQIAQRFSIQVSEKAAAQAIPAIGAAGGAIVNTLFIDHFQDMARGHFIIRRLERKYDKEIVEEAYKSV